MITQEEIQDIFIPLIDIAYKTAGIKAEQLVGQVKQILARESKDGTIEEKEEVTKDGGE